MPPTRRAPAIRDNSDMVDEHALHITSEQANASFGPPKVHLRESDFNALQERAAEAEILREQLTQALAQQGQDSALAVQADGALLVQGFQFSPTGLIMPEQITPESWEYIGRILLRLEGSIQWLIGDWLVYGMDLQYGDIKGFAVYFERDEHTLYNYMSISRKVESSLRNELLSYNHHVAVSKLKPEQQKRALDYAAEKEPSVAVFRKWIQAEFGKISMRALSTSKDFSSMAKKAGKFILRDPATLKAEERETGLSYIAQMRAIFDEWEAKARS